MNRKLLSISMVIGMSLASALAQVGSQFISFTSPPTLRLGDSPFGLVASSSAGLPVTFTSSDSSVLALNESTMLVVRTTLGDFRLELLSSNAPSLVANFLSYGDGFYDALFHLLKKSGANGLYLQTGLYSAPYQPSLTNPLSKQDFLSIIDQIPPLKLIMNPSGLSNLRGTVSMVNTDATSASQWLINLTNNISLDTNNGRNNVFGRIPDEDMSVLDQFATLPVGDWGFPTLDAVPLQDLIPGQPYIYQSNLCVITSVEILNPSTNICIIGAGTATITAYQIGDLQTFAATPVKQKIIVTKRPQTISFTGSVNTTIGSQPITLDASSSSGLPVSLTCSKPNVATINGSSLVIKGIGQAIITASQTGNEVYLPAPKVTQILTVGKANQIITFPQPNDTVFGVAPSVIAGTCSSGLPITLKASPAQRASITGKLLTIKGAGTVTITATQPGNATYNAATPVTRTMVINQGNQTINFAKPMPGSGKAITLSAVSTAKLPVALTANPAGILTIKGNTSATPIGTGTVSIVATQVGNTLWAPAAPVTNSLVISALTNSRGTTNGYSWSSVP